MVTMATLAPNVLSEVLGGQFWVVGCLRLGRGLTWMELKSTDVSSQEDDITLMPSG